MLFRMLDKGAYKVYTKQCSLHKDDWKSIHLLRNLNNVVCILELLTCAWCQEILMNVLDYNLYSKLLSVSSQI